MGTYDLFVRKKLFRNFGSQESEKLTQKYFQKKFYL
jgi:hypothetical protein